MKAIVVTDQAAGTAGVKLVERPKPQAAINDVVVQIHASVRFVPSGCLAVAKCDSRLPSWEQAFGELARSLSLFVRLWAD